MKSPDGVRNAALALTVALAGCYLSHRPAPAGDSCDGRPAEAPGFYYYDDGSGDGRRPVVVRLDRLAAVARESATRAEIDSFARSFGATLAGEWCDRDPMLVLGCPLESRGLLDLARRIREARASPLRVAGVVVESQGVPVLMTDEFFVQFRGAATREQIDALNALYFVEVLVESPLVASQFLLRVTPDSATSALDMANVYYETGLAEWSEPNFWLCTLLTL